METSGVMPVYDMNRSDNMSGGMGWYWVFFLFFLLAWGGNGFGGFGGNNAATNQINNDFLYTNLKSTLDNGFTQNANQNFTIQKDLGQGFAGVNQNLSSLGYIMQNDTCKIENAIGNTKYENAQNTCAIVNSNTANTQKILDRLCQMENNAKSQQISDLQAQLQTANFQLSQQAQNAYLIGALRPTPAPAYLTCSPYQSQMLAMQNLTGNCGGCC